MTKLEQIYSHLPRVEQEQAKHWAVLQYERALGIPLNLEPIKNSMKSVKVRESKAILLEQMGPICQICRVEFLPEQLNIDHIVPRSRGGMNLIQNYQLTCEPCNEAKSNLLPAEFAIWKREEAEMRAMIGVLL